MAHVVAVRRRRLEVAWRTFRSIYFGGLAPRTRTEYRSTFKRALHELPRRLTAGAAERWYRVRLMGELGFSPAYANILLCLVQTVARRAALTTGDHQLVAVLAPVRPVKPPVRAPRCPPRDFVARALAVCRNPAEVCWCLLAGLAGLRQGELLGLRPEDWDPSTSVLRVERQRHCGHRKNRRPHAVRIDHPALRAALVWLLEHRTEAASQRARSRGGSDGYLFPWTHGYTDGFLRRLHLELGPGQLPRGVGWHAFRHWGASELARRGASVWKIQAWLGDSSPDMAASYVDTVRGSTTGSVAELGRSLRQIQRTLRLVRRRRGGAAAAA